MDYSLLLIVKYLLKRKNAIIADKYTDSFFSNGLSFPIFIAKILNFPSIPDIKANPESKSDCDYNNNLAYQFFLEFNDNNIYKSFKFESKRGKILFLRSILTNYCFPDNSSTVIKKFNLIVKSLNIQINNEKDLFTFKNISLLLNAFTDGSFPIVDSYDDIVYYCSMSKIPVVTNEECIENDNLDIFLVLIQILFDFFSGCDNQMLDNIKKQLKEAISISQQKEDDNHEQISISEDLPSDTDIEIQAIDLWNRSTNNYSNIDGILTYKSPQKCLDFIDSYADGEIVGQKNLYQIFKYDEKKYCWSFCQQEFEKLFGLPKQDPKIPLVVIINSCYSILKKWNKIFTSSTLDRNYGNDISVFGYQQERLETNEKKFFLYLYVPKKKVGIKNIRSIFYQIYTFLYLICDVSVVLYSNHDSREVRYDYKLQTQFIKNLTKMSENYLNSQNSNGKNIFIDHSQLLFVINIEEKEYMPKLAQYISDNIKKRNKIFLDIAKDKFNSIINNGDFSNSYRFSELKELFMYCDTKFSEISELYLFINLDLRNEDHPYFARSIIDTRFDSLFSHQKYLNTKGLIIDDLKKESEPFYPQCDKNFSTLFEKCLIEKAFETNQFEKIKLVNELKKYSQKNLEKFGQKVKENNFISQNQIDTFKKKHISLLQKQYFEIIKQMYKGSINLVYEISMDVLQSQISEDNEKIYMILKNNEKQESSQNSEKYEDINKRSTNYVVKEIEKEREIEINIDSEDDLNKLIPQDF